MISISDGKNVNDVKFSDLEKSIAQSAPFERQDSSHNTNPPPFRALFKHPLPISETSYQREALLRRILSAKSSKQCAAAVSIGMQ
jgi:hypothetical protein